MRYQFIFRPENTLTIELDGRIIESATPLLEGPRFSWETCVGEQESLGGVAKELVESLFQVDGVAEMELKRYTIVLKKSPLFLWQNMLPEIHRRIEAILTGSGDFTRAGPAVFVFYDDEGLEHVKQIDIKEPDQSISLILLNPSLQPR